MVEGVQLSSLYLDFSSSHTTTHLSKILEQSIPKCEVFCIQIKRESALNLIKLASERHGVWKMSRCISLFAEPKAGKARAGKLEENSRSPRAAGTLTLC